MRLDLRPGNHVQLLENGEQFYPAVFEAIGAAREEVLIETFILFDDEVGRSLQRVLIETAGRGVRIDLTVDGYGSADLPPEFIGALTAAGVRFHVFDPIPRLPFGLRTNLLRRLHRKLVAIDARVAFVGGINYSADHLLSFGPMAKQDYAVRIEGPLAVDIRAFASEALAPTRRRHGWGRIRRGRPATDPALRVGDAEAAFVTRDNRRHRDDIERVYRAALRSAREEIVIANAYFFPGWRLLRDMVRAARRGVRVRLILQGEPDMAWVRVAARMLYRSLIRDGVQIYEYCKRPLHGKVAVFDGRWSTVGSSNLDPLSLSLNLEANVVVDHAGFAAELGERLEELRREHCRLIRLEHLPRRTWWRYLLGALTFHVVRRFPAWLQRLPGRVARIRSFDRQRGVETVSAHERAEPVGDGRR
ncbi:MAG: cardiolipin synthase ClsB [Betaproteobacteria bacterium]